MTKTMPFKIYIYQGKIYSKEHIYISYALRQTLFENLFDLIKMNAK
jgi:hypothetical protein